VRAVRLHVVGSSASDRLSGGARGMKSIALQIQKISRLEKVIALPRINEEWKSHLRDRFEKGMKCSGETPS
jgi:hypothetical protein